MSKTQKKKIVFSIYTNKYYENIIDSRDNASSECYAWVMLKVAGHNYDRNTKTIRGEHNNNTAAGAMILIARCVHEFRTCMCLSFT